MTVQCEVTNFKAYVNDESTVQGANGWSKCITEQASKSGNTSPTNTPNAGQMCKAACSS